MKRPVIGISVSVDANSKESLLPGTLLYYINSEVVRAIEQCGGVPLLIPSTKINPSEILTSVDGVVITGGLRPLPKHLAERKPLPSLEEQNPLRYAYDYALIQAVLQGNLPLLGICRGMQMLNEVAGGTLERQVSTPEAHRTPPGAKATKHMVRIAEDSHLRKIVREGAAEVNSFHVQAVEMPGRDMRISARADDGTVEAIESISKRFVVGVQFHPEGMLSSTPAERLFAERLFSAFVEAALETAVY